MYGNFHIFLSCAQEGGEGSDEVCEKISFDKMFISKGAEGEGEEIKNYSSHPTKTHLGAQKPSN
jgi:hypothetical protein